MTATDLPRADIPGYVSAAFRLDSPGILFQFKLRHSKTAPLFALVCRNSRALDRLKAGTTIPMTFYHRDKTVPPLNLETRISYIRDTGAPGPGNTVMVGLELTA